MPDCDFRDDRFQPVSADLHARLFGHHAAYKNQPFLRTGEHLVSHIFDSSNSRTSPATMTSTCGAYSAPLNRVSREAVRCAAAQRGSPMTRSRRADRRTFFTSSSASRARWGREVIGSLRMISDSRRLAKPSASGAGWRPPPARQEEETNYSVMTVLGGELDPGTGGRKSARA